MVTIKGLFFIEERWYCDNEIGKSQNETEEFEITWRNNLCDKRMLARERREIEWWEEFDDMRVVGREARN